MANAKAGGTFLCSGTCRLQASGHRSRRVAAHHPEGLHNGEQEEPQQQEVVDFQVEELVLSLWRQRRESGHIAKVAEQLIALAAAPLASMMAAG